MTSKTSSYLFTVILFSLSNSNVLNRMAGHVETIL